MIIRKEKLSPTTNDVNLDCFDSELSWLNMVVPPTVKTPQNQSDSQQTKEDEVLTDMDFSDLLSFMSNYQPEVNQSPKSRRQETVSNCSNFPQLRISRSYRNYRGKDLLDAIEEVRIGNMSALQASRKYGVPTRTLYDKVKKIRDGMEVYIS